MTNYFTQSSDADAIAATLLPSLLPNYLASVDPTKTAALLQASIDVDGNPNKYQGRKYDPINQLNEFPRVPFPIDLSYCRPLLDDQSLSLAPVLSEQVWDWDTVNLVAIVPQQVLMAVIFQADWLLSAHSPPGVWTPSTSG